MLHSTALDKQTNKQIILIIMNENSQLGKKHVYCVIRNVQTFKSYKMRKQTKNLKCIDKIRSV